MEKGSCETAQVSSFFCVREQAEWREAPKLGGYNELHLRHQRGLPEPQLRLPPHGFLSLLLPLLFLRGLRFSLALVLGPRLRVLLSLGLQLFLGGSWRWWRRRGGHPRGYYDLVLPLSVGDDCAQQQGEDGHEVEVPLGAQKLVQVHLRDYFLQLREGNTHKDDSFISFKPQAHSNRLTCVCVCGGAALTLRS